LKKRISCINITAMKRFPFAASERSTSRNFCCRLALAGGLSLWLASLHADQIEMQNGDKYNAKVVSMNNETVVIQSDVLGTVKLPRSQVANVTIGTPVSPTPAVATQPSPQATRSSGSAAAAITNNLSSTVRQLASDTNLVDQVQNQYLAGADPAAKAKFNELLTGLSTGAIGMNDLRAQAKSAADQLRALKKEAGGSADDALDSYLAILDSFLKETQSADVPATKTTPTQPRAKTPAAGED
jgi:hypothetical protein